MEQERYNNLKLGEKGAIISIIAYICLSAIKLWIGNTANSEALRADGLNNATDIVASIAVLIGLRLSQKPADRDHPYGHWKAETVASLIASFIMMAVGIQVLIGAISSVFSGQHESPDLISAWTGIFCAIVMYFVYRYNKRLAVRINSQAVMATAKDNLSDAWVSVGAVIGIVGAQFGLPWLDPLTAVLVGFLICKTAWDIFRDASHHLTDGFDEDTIRAYRTTVQQVYGVKGVKDIRARNYGSNTVVDIVILVKSNLDIRLAHDISDQVEHELKQVHGVYDVHVHIEPN
ncbi:manganese transporter MneS [Paenibacillus sp. JCM 10914]|uniref:cation diffusion facilitator family transporter n=1 Tax=Paenibacillus sp. JCM 10914 TaxID=1236974 RepID=UPI0003CC8D09|nr:cation diffusion facilitator family transporter [Paenibacillus sp. JCM 10914]GAE05496.1 cobalt-zinc-cadmium resistance protein [Paenibacillus sp. JCM 10914]